MTERKRKKAPPRTLAIALRLDIKTAAFVKRIAKDSGQTDAAVINVLLAMAMYAGVPANV